MAERSRDWIVQAEHDLKHARNASADGDFEWACFAAQQAAEKAVKAVFQALGGDGWGHSIVRLLRDLPADLRVPNDLVEQAMVLDRLYVPSRYPNGLPEGAPAEFFSARDAALAIQHAEAILAFCRKHLPRL